ncbi:trypsin-like serine protease [Aquimarina gracilis]|uniref:Serine protease n=1 Tax=Aquimarina gracilis TaxID=874422 RepID=A0ABU5ZX51_9FLAO|nr:trypsin-like serine protease [Aquimarina gracilis]MEB3346437.1 trypsin-like serine protease [Aquimarina gracilis]
MEKLVFHELNGNINEINESEITTEPWVEPENEPTAESLCGIDQRQKVVSTNQLPYIAICKLYMKATNGRTYVGSGWLVSEDKLYTAGHCVFNHRSGGWKENIIVIPAKSGLSEPYGRYEAISLAATEGWVDNKSTRYDMGAIKLNTPVPFKDFIIPSIEDSNYGEICGYPGDRDNGLFQYRMTDNLIKTSGRFQYYADTFGGQSGGALLKNRAVAIGIHNYGGCPNKSSDLYESFIKEVADW